jgi:hypothetical protein
MIFVGCDGDWWTLSAHNTRPIEDAYPRNFSLLHALYFEEDVLSSTMSHLKGMVHLYSEEEEDDDDDGERCALPVRYLKMDEE